MDVINETGATNHTPSQWEALNESLNLRFQYYLDKATVYFKTRWVVYFLLIVLYFYRVIRIQGYYIITYALGIYILNQFLGFISPNDLDPNADPLLPLNSEQNENEFQPFYRKVPEFKFWYAITRATLIAFGCTFLEVFDIPAYWPILLVYFITLFTVTMKDRVAHMIKYRYVPWSRNAKKYNDAPVKEYHEPSKPSHPSKSNHAD